MPAPRKSLLGQTFGKLTVKAYVGKAPNGSSLWEVFCAACQNTKVMRYSTLTHADRNIRTCGCGRGRKRRLFPLKKK